MSTQKICLEFVLTMESDWHVSAGYGEGTVADSVLERDSQGRPIIRGSALRGLFRDALLLMETLPYLNASGLVESVLLDAQGHSRWSFGWAQLGTEPLEGSPETGTDLAVLATGVKIDRRTRRAERRKLFRREMGLAGQKFSFAVEGTGSQQDAELLVMAACLIRSLGGMRRRGAGQCRVELQEAELHEALLMAFETRCSGGVPQSLKLPTPKTEAYDSSADAQITARRFALVVHADSPIINTIKPEAGNVFSSRPVIAGRRAWGALAARIGPGELNGGDYALFQDLFMLDGISIGPLIPFVPGTGAVDEVPLGLLPDTQRTFFSALRENPKEPAKPYRGKYHGLYDGYPAYDRAIKEVSPQVHVQIDPATQRASDGNLYAYEVIPEGRWFVGEVVLNTRQWADLNSLLKVSLNEPFRLRLGKRTGATGYGQCTAWLIPLEDQAPPVYMPVPLETRLALSQRLGGGWELFITLASDTILLDPWMRGVMGFDVPVLSSELGFDVSVDNQTIAITTVQGFDSRSGLPRWTDMALVRGSTARLVVGFNPAEYVNDLQLIEEQGIGVLRGMGFGRVIFNHPAHIGLREGFQPIEFPAVPAKAASSTSQLIDRWQQELDRALSSRLKGVHYRALARKLVEDRPSNAQAVKALLDSMGKIETGQQVYELDSGLIANRGKKERFDSTAIKEIGELVNMLGGYPDRFWQTGLRLLAEAIAARIEKGED